MTSAFGAIFLLLFLREWDRIRQRDVIRDYPWSPDLLEKLEAKHKWFSRKNSALVAEGLRRSNEGLRRIWWHSCKQESIHPTRLPLLFAFNKKLNIANGFHYTTDCADLRRAAVGAATPNCGGDFGDSGFDGSTSGMATGAADYPRRDTVMAAMVMAAMVMAAAASTGAAAVPVAAAISAWSLTSPPTSARARHPRAWRPRIGGKLPCRPDRR
jgi:hypothetical protein